MLITRRRASRSPEIQLTSFMDIVSYLLFFFMVATTFRANAAQFPIDLPKASQAAAQMRTQFIVTVDRQGEIYLDNSRVDQAQLQLATMAALKTDPSLFVVIRADRQVQYGAVVQVIDALRAAGVNSLGLAVERVPAQTPGQAA
ncbi:MAG: biopolymer transporter ExbD [Limnochordaceae bacterium]|nr:biopolymer transporter ExbD [Limnochordaceae bacterium]